MSIRVAADLSNMADAKLSLIQAHLRDATGTNKITKSDAIGAAIMAVDPVQCATEFEPQETAKKRK